MPKQGSRGLEMSVESQRRRQIMQAVMACIAEDGLEKTTMRNVGLRAGVSTGTLSYYFGSKKELVDAALLDASQQYMERFNAYQHPAGAAALDKLIDSFLAAGNEDASFVLQMIEVGLHNSELRGTHLEMVDAGRKMIEASLRAGAEAGQYRDDVDPVLAAALLHGVLIWWGSELVWNATSRDLAIDVNRLLVRLLEPPARNGGPSTADQTARPAAAGKAFSTADHLRSVLLADRRLSREKARTLADAFEKLYEMASDETA